MVDFKKTILRFEQCQAALSDDGFEWNFQHKSLKTLQLNFLRGIGDSLNEMYVTHNPNIEFDIKEQVSAATKKVMLSLVASAVGDKISNLQWTNFLVDVQEKLTTCNSSISNLNFINSDKAIEVEVIDPVKPRLKNLVIEPKENTLVAESIPEAKIMKHLLNLAQSTQSFSEISFICGDEVCSLLPIACEAKNLIPGPNLTEIVSVVSVDKEKFTAVVRGISKDSHLGSKRITVNYDSNIRKKVYSALSSECLAEIIFSTFLDPNIHYQNKTSLDKIIDVLRICDQQMHQSDLL